MIREKEKLVCLKLLKLFSIDGKTADQVVTEGQLEIFHALVFRKHKRVQILSSTQYGKSLFVALACIIISCIQDEMVAVVAPTDDKAKIIMRYYIDHLGDNVLFYSQLEKNTKLERLRMEESKERIVLRNRGGIYAISAQAGARKGVEAAMGEGSKIVVIDEACLIPDEIEATIFRMIAGKGEDAFYCKIGNPWYRNHFMKSSNDPSYQQIFIDYHRGLAEGRYTLAMIEEARKKPHFDVLFECTFPPEDMIDTTGYIRLFTDELIEKAQRVVEPFGERRLGVDIAEGGGDSNALVLRTANYATVLLKFQSENTMSVPGQVIQAGKEYDVFDHNWFLDKLGVGKGAFDRLTEQNYRPHPVAFSERADEDASDPTQYANKRAECYFLTLKWLREGGCLEPGTEWDQLKSIKYKVDSSGRMQLMPKKDMRAEGIPSPDIADALAMTFARRSVVNVSREQRKEDKELLRQFDYYKKDQRVGGTKYQRR